MTSFDIIQFNGANVSYLTGKPYGLGLPRWDGSQDPFPGISNNKGYDVVAPQFPQARREAAYNVANAQISDGQHQWPLFVHDVQIDIALAGTTAQSRQTRDFYPHNFVQPSFMITGQALDQRDYGNLTGFCHLAQKHALDGTLMQLYVKGMGIDGSQSSNRGVHRDGKFYPNQMIRGSHQQLLCQGYVTSMPRIHKKADVSPTYSFGFVVADMMQGPYQENLVQVMQQQTWLDIVKSSETFKVDGALLKENTKILNYIAKNSDNILNTGGGASANTNTNNISPTGTLGPGTGSWTSVTGTFFTDTSYSCGGTSGTNGGLFYAELNGGVLPSGNQTMSNPGLGPIFGFPSGLPCGFRLEVRNPVTGQSATFIKNDIGSGAPGAQIDLYVAGSNAIGFTNIGKGSLQIRKA